MVLISFVLRFQTHFNCNLGLMSKEHVEVEPSTDLGSVLLNSALQKKKLSNFKLG